MGALFFLFCCFAMKRAVVVLPVWRSDLLDVGHRGRRSRGTSKQRRVSEAQLGRESRDVSQSAEKKSDVSGAGLSVRVRQRVGATILQGADKSVSRTFCAAACFSAPPGRIEQNDERGGSAEVSGSFGHSRRDKLGAVQAGELFGESFVILGVQAHERVPSALR